MESSDPSERAEMEATHEKFVMVANFEKYQMAQRNTKRALRSDTTRDEEELLDEYILAKANYEVALAARDEFLSDLGMVSY